HAAQAVVDDLWRPERRTFLYPVLTRFLKEHLRLHFAERRITDVTVKYPETYLEQVVATVKKLRHRPVTESVFWDEITYLRLATSSPKAFESSTRTVTSRPIDKLIALRSVLERHRREQVIVFCEFQETAGELSSAIEDRPTFVITGD